MQRHAHCDNKSAHVLKERTGWNSSVTPVILFNQAGALLVTGLPSGVGAVC